MGRPSSTVVAPLAVNARAAADAPTLRLARGAGAATASTTIALLSHLLAGGALPGALGIVVPLLISTSLCSVLAGVRMPWTRLTASVALSQVLFHTLFVLGTGTAVSPSAPGHGAHHPGADATAAVLRGDGQTAHLGHPSAGMWVAHGMAAVATVLALRHGEILATRLGRAVRRAARRFIALRPHTHPVGSRPRRTSSPVIGTGRTPHPLVLSVGGPTRRGPPPRVAPVPG